MPFGRELSASLKRQSRLIAAEVVDDTLAISRIPAPTGDELRRSLAVRDLFRRDDPGRLVYLDQAGNVVTRIPGRQRDRSVLVAAHLDTIFGADVPHLPRLEGSRLVGPGVGDNGVALAAMIALPRLFSRCRIVPACDVVLIATVGEEGYGNLRGITAALDLNREAAAVIAVEGHGLGRITHIAVGSRRVEIRIEGPGGHSWADYGRPSAVHAAGRLTARLAEIQTPEWPRTTLNVASITGGSTINSIATSASLQVEIRSMDAGILESLLGEVVRQVRLVERDGLRVTIETLGVRPAGGLPSDHLIVRRARSVLASLGTPSASDASSTDANVPIAWGIPAVCIGISHGGDAHTPNEWLEREPIATGLTQLGLLVRTVAEDVERGDLRRIPWSGPDANPMSAASD
ncbi:MAG: Acetylornithine deacetylase [uncultured Thermomicrobiales bacterium]|uniref:Acetylornithine deacetylase n=1 Tax=uncultured Thermomicrobiales bacterium TaxID=1645740 RepID=A0A6J4UXV0_9BACT|nr:MAG: Acetylornithine deacetylase [uncultured Thermomicrobiales bacterium]